MCSRLLEILRPGMGLFLNASGAVGLLRILRVNLHEYLPFTALDSSALRGMEIILAKRFISFYLPVIIQTFSFYQWLPESSLAPLHGRSVHAHALLQVLLLDVCNPCYLITPRSHPSCREWGSAESHLMMESCCRHRFEKQFPSGGTSSGGGRRMATPKKTFPLQFP